MLSPDKLVYDRRVSDPFKDRDRIDWSTFVPGDLLDIEVLPRHFRFDDGQWATQTHIQGVYLGCAVIEQERFLRIMKADGINTVRTSSIVDIMVVSSLEDSLEDGDD